MADATVDVFGVTIAISSDISEFALMEFADAAENSGSGMQKLASMYRLLKECVAPADWQTFRKAAMAAKATEGDLVGVISAAFGANTGHPSGPSADSSDGPTPTEASSTDGSSSPVIARLEEQEHPRLDLGRVVRLADRARAAS